MIFFVFLQKLNSFQIMILRVLIVGFIAAVWGFGSVAGLIKKLRQTPEPTVGPVINRPLVKGDLVFTDIGKIRILEQLGNGSFGSVFKAHWMQAKRLVAVKVEIPQPVSRCILGPAPRQYLSIEHEWRMMAGMNRTDGFPLVFTHNFTGKYKYYVMQLLGKTLHSIRSKSAGKVLDTRTVIKYGSQMLRRIEALHARDILMYDIHLGNFLVSPEGKVYVIDLGMAIPFRYDNGHHVLESDSPVSRDCKNSHYVSRNDAESRSVSRRDDLERLIYILVDLNIHQLPWGNVKGWTDSKKIKLKANPSDICVGNAAWLKPALEYVFSLNFTERPNYAHIYKHFDDTLKRMR